MTEQRSLSSVAGLQVVEPVHDPGGDGPRCPDCGAAVAASKGGHPLPDDAPAARVHGWRCEACENVLPVNCHGPDAPSFIGSIVGVEVPFRDGTTRYVPVPDSAAPTREGSP